MSIGIICGVCNSENACICNYCLFTKVLQMKLSLLNLSNGQSDKVSNVLNQSIRGEMDDTLQKWLNSPHSVPNGVPMLNHLLLKVSNKKLDKEIGEIQAKVLNLRDNNRKLSERIQIMNIELNGERGRISKLPTDVNNEYLNKIIKIQDSIETLDTLTLPNQKRYIKQYQWGIINELFDFWAVKLNNNQIINILFTPIISIDLMPIYPIEFIRTSVINLCMFTNTIASVLGIDLPFKMELTDSGYLQIEAVKFLDTEKTMLSDLSKKEIIEVGWCLAKVSLNIIEIVVCLGLIKRWKLTLGDASSSGKLVGLIYNKFHTSQGMKYGSNSVDVSGWTRLGEVDTTGISESVNIGRGFGDMKMPIGSMDSQTLALYLVKLLDVLDPTLGNSMGVLVEGSGIC